MRYSVDKKIFEICPEIQFGILIAHGITNRNSNTEDVEAVRKAEESLRSQYTSDEVREIYNVRCYRDIMKDTGINPNKFPPSVEAMFKRILKGGELPVINALVDLCNVVSISNVISLGAHDLKDMKADLEVRFGKEDDVFLPFGETETEKIDTGELIFTSGKEVQTRKWVWRQSELGKITLDSKDIFFQLVGFESKKELLQNAVEDIETMVLKTFGGTVEPFIVTVDNREIEFE